MYMASLIEACAHGRRPTLAGYIGFRGRISRFLAGLKRSCSCRTISSTTCVGRAGKDYSDYSVVNACLVESSFGACTCELIYVAFSSDFGAQGFSGLLIADSHGQEGEESEFQARESLGESSPHPKAISAGWSLGSVSSTALLG